MYNFIEVCGHDNDYIGPMKTTLESLLSQHSKEELISAYEKSKLEEAYINILVQNCIIKKYKEIFLGRLHTNYSQFVKDFLQSPEEKRKSLYEYFKKGISLKMHRNSNFSTKFENYEHLAGNLHDKFIWSF